MRVIKMLGAALIGFAALVGVSVNAQTLVSCSWNTVSSEGPSNGSVKYIVQQCKESNGAVIATRNFVWSAANGLQSCSMTTAPSISYTGDCLQPVSPTFYRAVVSSSSAQSSSTASSVSACTTPGMQVHGGFCANSVNPALLTNPTYIARCGAGCSLEFKSVGWTSTCPNSGNNRSPEYGVFCK
jgi:hypothetical protein